MKKEKLWEHERCKKKIKECKEKARKILKKIKNKKKNREDDYNIYPLW